MTSTSRTCPASSTRATTREYVLLPSLCVGSDGAVESVQLVTDVPLPAVRSIAVTGQSASSGRAGAHAVPRRRDPCRGRRRRRSADDRRPGAAVGVRRPARRTTTSARCGASAPACRWCSPSGPRGSARPASTSSTAALAGAVADAHEHSADVARAAAVRYGYPAGLPGPVLREAPVPFRRAGARRTRAVLRARRTPRGPSTRCRRSASSPTSKASPDGDRHVHPRGLRDPRPRAAGPAHHRRRRARRCSSSRDLVAIGQAADELRNRKVDPDEVTFIVDRNINYSNVCVTDCDFCAFYRRPGDHRRATRCRRA